MLGADNKRRKEEDDERMRVRILAQYEREALEAAYAQASVTSFEFTEKLLLRQTLIVGATGSGKSNHAFHIIKQSLPARASCLIIDVKREYRKLRHILDREVRVLAVGDEPRVRFNPLAHPKEAPTGLWDRAFADVFIRSYSLGEPSRRIILDSVGSLRKDPKKRDGPHPTLRELEKEVADFQARSSREQNSQRSLESRLHNMNEGPVGESLNADDGLDMQSFDGKVIVFEIGRVDSARDQRFLAETMLMGLWQRDKAVVAANEDLEEWKEDDGEEEGAESLRRLIVVEEAHRCLSEERPPAQRGDRTLLELAIAEARRYGWGFMIVDQMPSLLSQYVWDNAGTVLVHRLTNVESFKIAKNALGGDPTPGASTAENERYPLAMRLPEDLAFFRRYAEAADPGVAVGSTLVPRVRPVGSAERMKEEGGGGRGGGAEGGPLNQTKGRTRW